MRETKPFNGCFSRELRQLLYGCGDVLNPRQDTVELLENYVIDYITEVMLAAKRHARNKLKVKTDDIMAVIKHDKKKFNRLEELLFINEEVKMATKAFDMKKFE